MTLDKLDAAGDGFLVTGAFNNSGFVFGGDNFTTRAEHFEANFFKLHAFVGGNDGGVGQNGDIFHNFFAAITERWGFEDESIKDAFELVEDKDGKSFTFNLFGNDDEIFFAGLGTLLKERDELTGARDLFVGDE